VGDGDAHSRRLFELNPPYRGLITPPNMIESAIGCINHDDLRRLSEATGLVAHIAHSFIQAFFVFTDDYNRDHRWNTSEEPFV
jgi:hypothetical protein